MDTTATVLATASQMTTAVADAARLVEARLATLEQAVIVTQSPEWMTYANLGIALLAAIATFFAWRAGERAADATRSANDLTKRDQWLRQLDSLVSAWEREGYAMVLWKLDFAFRETRLARLRVGESAWPLGENRLSINLSASTSYRFDVIKRDGVFVIEQDYVPYRPVIEGAAAAIDNDELAPIVVADLVRNMSGIEWFDLFGPPQGNRAILYDIYAWFSRAAVWATSAGDSINGQPDDAARTLLDVFGKSILSAATAHVRFCNRLFRTDGSGIADYTYYRSAYGLTDDGYLNFVSTLASAALARGWSEEALQARALLKDLT